MLATWQTPGGPTDAPSLSVIPASFPPLTAQPRVLARWPPRPWVALRLAPFSCRLHLGNSEFQRVVPPCPPPPHRCPHPHPKPGSLPGLPGPVLLCAWCLGQDSDAEARLGFSASLGTGGLLVWLGDLSYLIVPQPGPRPQLLSRLWPSVLCAQSPPRAA